MLELLLSTELSCNDARDIISRIQKRKDIFNLEQRIELIETVKDSTKGCNFYARPKHNQ
jgi:hypothetical protein|tara:strand:+ start:54 stop:230 length:177 start_codon:yes stop_codon:yes gene_type:complete